jgi:hypothetical protein
MGMLTLHEVLHLLREKKSYEIDLKELVVLTKEQLGEMISADFNQSIACLDDGSLELTFQEVDKEVADAIQQMRKQLFAPVTIIFHLQYLLNPKLQFSYKDNVYRDIVSMGEKILDGKVDKQEIIEAMESHLVSHYLAVKEMQKEDPKRVEGVLYSENYLSKDKEVAYMLLGYYLSGRKFYRFQGRKFLSVGTLYDYLMAKQCFNRFAKDIDTNMLFKAWLYYLGYDKIVEKWNELVVDLDAPVKY